MKKITKILIVTISFIVLSSLLALALTANAAVTVNENAKHFRLYANKAEAEADKASGFNNIPSGGEYDLLGAAVAAIPEGSEGYIVLTKDYSSGNDIMQSDFSPIVRNKTVTFDVNGKNIDLLSHTHFTYNEDGSINKFTTLSQFIYVNRGGVMNIVGKGAVRCSFSFAVITADGQLNINGGGLSFTAYRVYNSTTKEHFTGCDANNDSVAIPSGKGITQGFSGGYILKAGDVNGSNQSKPTLNLTGTVTISKGGYGTTSLVSVAGGACVNIGDKSGTATAITAGTDYTGATFITLLKQSSETHTVVGEINVQNATLNSVRCLAFTVNDKYASASLAESPKINVSNSTLNFKGTATDYASFRFLSNSRCVVNISGGKIISDDKAIFDNAATGATLPKQSIQLDGVAIELSASGKAVFVNNAAAKLRNCTLTIPTGAYVSNGGYAWIDSESADNTLGGYGIFVYDGNFFSRDLTVPHVEPGAYSASGEIFAVEHATSGLVNTISDKYGWTGKSVLIKDAHLFPQIALSSSSIPVVSTYETSSLESYYNKTDGKNVAVDNFSLIIGTGGVRSGLYSVKQQAINSNNKYFTHEYYYNTSTMAPGNPSPYLSFGTAATASVNSSTGVISPTNSPLDQFKYYVIDMDIMTPTGAYTDAFGASFYFRSYYPNKKADGTYERLYYYFTSTGIVLSANGEWTFVTNNSIKYKMDTTPGRWHHISLVLELSSKTDDSGAEVVDASTISESKLHLYVDGKFAATCTNALSTSMNLTDTNVKYYQKSLQYTAMEEVRIAFKDQSEVIDEDNETAIDNVAVTKYAFGSGLSIDYVANYVNDNITSFDTVDVPRLSVTDKDGKVEYFNDVADAMDAIESGDTVTLLSNITEDYSPVIPHTINKNGYSLNLKIVDENLVYETDENGYIVIREATDADKLTVNWYALDGTTVIKTQTVTKGNAIERLVPTLTESNGWYKTQYKWVDEEGNEPENSDKIVINKNTEFKQVFDHYVAYATAVMYSFNLNAHYRSGLFVPQNVDEEATGVSSIKVYSSRGNYDNKITATVQRTNANVGAGVPYTEYYLGYSGACNIASPMRPVVTFDVKLPDSEEKVTLVQYFDLSIIDYLEVLYSSEAYSDLHKFVADMMQYTVELAKITNATLSSRVYDLYDESVKDRTDLSTLTLPESTANLGQLDDYIYAISLDATSYEPGYMLYFRENIRKDGVDTNVPTRVKNVEFKIFGYVYGQNGVNIGPSVYNMRSLDGDRDYFDENKTYLQRCQTTSISIYNFDFPIEIYLTVVDSDGSTKTVVGTYDMSAYYEAKLKNTGSLYAHALYAFARTAAEYRYPSGKLEPKKEYTYEEFGAVGDGKTNDFAAIKAAHDFVNKYVGGGYSGFTIKATPGAKYYIGETGGQSIVVRTSVDWTGAEFIIDDTELSINSNDKGVSIFNVAYNSGALKYFDLDNVKVQNLNAKAETDTVIFAKGTTPKIDLGLGYPAILIIENADQKNFIRRGSNEDDGSNQKEVVIVDAEGNVSEETPFQQDMTHITHITTYRLDGERINLTGGKFTTIARNIDFEKDADHLTTKNGVTLLTNYTSFSRGIRISRSGVTVDGLEYYIEGEGDYGVCYGAFLFVVNSDDVVVKNSKFTAHRTYDCWGTDVNKTRVSMGTYGISANSSTNVVWQNCTQSNFFHLDENGNPTDILSSIDVDGVKYWGIMGSSYCKNLRFEGCKLSRFDAHCGVYNAQIIDSEIITLSVIGGGELYVENSVLYSTGGASIAVRDDYGSVWDGDITLKGVTIDMSAVPGNAPTLISGYWFNWNYGGYNTALPSNISIDNLKLRGTNKTTVYIFRGTLYTTTDSIFSEKVTTQGLLPQGAVSVPTEDGKYENLNRVTTSIKSITVVNNEADYDFELINGTPGTALNGVKIEIVDAEEQ